MKLAFSTLPCMEYSPVQLKALCDKYGLVGAEVRIRSDGGYQHGDGLYVTDVGSSICFKGYNEAALQKAKETVADISAKGIKAIRIFLGNFIKRYDSPRQPIDHAGIVKMLQELCDSTDIEIWVETHNEYATGKALARLLQDVDRSNMKIIWDIIHPIEDGEAPDETLAYLGKHIAHVHIKDGRKNPDPVWHNYVYTPLGEGSLPIGQIVTLLEQSGYTGCYSLEWENAWKPELQELGWSVDEILDKFVQYMKTLNLQ